MLLFRCDGHGNQLQMAGKKVKGSQKNGYPPRQ